MYIIVNNYCNIHKLISSLPGGREKLKIKVQNDDIQLKANE
jgi:hypothetical protein